MSVSRMRSRLAGEELPDRVANARVGGETTDGGPGRI